MKTLLILAALLISFPAISSDFDYYPRANPYARDNYRPSFNQEIAAKNAVIRERRHYERIDFFMFEQRQQRQIENFNRQQRKYGH